MGIKISKANLYGVTLRGKQTLGTIGEEMFRYDYRSITPTSGNKVAICADLSNGFNLNQALDARRLDYYVDGFGATTLSSQSLRGVWKSSLNLFHNGDAYLINAVLSINGASSPAGSVLALFTTISGSNPGLTVRILADTNTFGWTRRNASSAQSRNSAGGLVPRDRFFLLSWYYTGSTSNVLKLIYEATTVTLTSPSLAVTSNDSITFECFQPAVAAVDFKIKFMNAYKCTGKTDAQIATQRAQFVSILKSDSEYSSLTT